MKVFISFTTFNYDISEQKLKHIIGNLQKQSPLIVEAAVTDNKWNIVLVSNVTVRKRFVY